MKVSVIFCTYNSKHFPKLALEALEKCKFSGELEIIFVDNDSTDRISLDFLEKAHEEGRVKLIKTGENLGFGKANNVGAQVATGKYLLLHNPDVTVWEDSIEELVNFAEKNTDIGLVAPKVVYANGKVQETYRRDMKFFDLVIKRTPLAHVGPFKKRLERYLMMDVATSSEPIEVDLITGAMMLIPKTVFQDVEGFDPRYFMFMEDFDLCKKIRKIGKKVIYYPKACVNHYHKRLSQDSLFKVIFKKPFWWHISSAMKYFWKWKNG